MKPDAKGDLLSQVADYYTGKLAEHGENPRGVDWNGEEGQLLRFLQLCRIIDPTRGFSINDLGCGYGALYDFLAPRYEQFTYSGIDVSESMIRAAEKRQRGNQRARFVISGEPDEVADYGVASGILNVKLGRSDAEWRAYVEATLDMLDRTSKLGFAFNCLTSYSDSDRMRAHLYYADPCILFDWCKRRYSKNVALLHDYDLYEFTMLIRKNS